jgi:hypothetical protein
MRDVLKRISLSSAPFWLLAAVALSVLLAIRSDRLPERDLRGDEGTYVAMAASLARDNDLAFGPADAAWAAREPGGVAVILERTGQGIFYSKPVLFPLLASPFYALFGARGLVVFNVLVLLVALLAARALLVRLGTRGRATETLLTFVFAGAVAAYLVWRMAESLQIALATAGLALALSVERPTTQPARGALERFLELRGAPHVGAFLLGLLVGLREPHAVVALVPAGAAALRRDGRRAVTSTLAVAAGYLLVLALTWGLTGAAFPYKAARSTFNATTGYPAGEAAVGLSKRFENPDDLATSTLSLAPRWQPAVSAYSTLYFFVGRHSGLLGYLPFVLVLLVLALRRPDRVTLAAVSGFAGLALFFLIWWPANYFGGETFVGNRYILAACPALLLGLGRLPSRRALLAAWAVAAVAGASAWTSVARTGESDPTSQSHAHAGIFRWLPYESTASAIDGRRDRYWSGDFLRFVDPYARADPWSFELTAGEPAAEVEVATTWSGAPTTWLVAADRPGATFVVSDWLRSRGYKLSPAGTGSGGPVSVDLSPPWRVHPFWWSQGAFARDRLLRFRLVGGDGEAVTARVRYLGRRSIPEVFSRRVEAPPLPDSLVFGIPGRSAAWPLRLTNTGSWTWSSEDPLTVQLGVRYLPAPGEGRAAHAGEVRIPLPKAVAPGESVEMTVPLDAPPTLGRYRVVVDLVLEDVTWFGDRTGSPLAAGEVDFLLGVE